MTLAITMLSMLVSGPGEYSERPGILPVVLICLVIWLIGLYVIGYIAWGVLGLPLQRQERARFFLDLLETGLADGQSPETTIVEIAKSRDKTLGARFHLLAVHLGTGLRLSEALKKVPGLLPAQLVAMLAAGEKVGDIRKVMPACRKVLTRGSSKTTSAVNYLILFLAINPFGGLIWPFITLKIVPALRATMLDYGHLPPIFRFLLAHGLLVCVVQWALIGMSYLLLVGVCSSQQRKVRRSAAALKSLRDAINYRLPWRRKRLERDFSAMLAILLDAEMPEEQAVTLAAQSTDNRVFIRRGERLAQRLRDGVPLTEAVEALDDTGEFRWRLTNAAHGRGGFMVALSGWHDALDAKAYQLEQAASQVITTGLVIVNGCVVGLIAVGLFQVLTSIAWEAALW